MRYVRRVKGAALGAVVVLVILHGGANVAFVSDFGLGTLIGNLSQRFGTGKMLRQKLEDERRANYGEDLSAKMEAWKAAGLHPLVGMGIGSEGPVVGYRPPEPHFRFASDAKVDPDTQRLRKAQADLAELQVKAAEQRLAGQPGNAPAPSFMEGQGVGADVRAVDTPGTYQFRPGSESRLPGYSDVGKVKPSESMSRSSAFPYMTATGDPALREYTVGPGPRGTGLKMLLPYSNEGVSETLENVKTWMWPWLYQQNVRHFGPDWALDFKDAFGIPRFNRRFRQAESPSRATQEPSMGISP